MFGLKKWVGWYEAIEDLIPTLPASKFAQWQLDRLPEFCDKTFVFEPTEMRDDGQQVTGDNPIYTIKAMRHTGARAFIVNNQQSDDHRGGTYGVTVRNDDEPAITITDSFVPKAFLVDDQHAGTPDENGERGLTIRRDNEPIHTVSATQMKRSIRAWLSQGRVVAMTPRCLARFQSFPDDYILPASNKLACQVIGNAVPPLLYQRVIEAQL